MHAQYHKNDCLRHLRQRRLSQNSKQCPILWGQHETAPPKLGYMARLAAQAKIDALFECLHSQTLTVYDERSLSYTVVEQLSQSSNSFSTTAH